MASNIIYYINKIYNLYISSPLFNEKMPKHFTLISGCPVQPGNLDKVVAQKLKLHTAMFFCKLRWCINGNCVQFQIRLVHS